MQMLKWKIRGQSVLDQSLDIQNLTLKCPHISHLIVNKFNWH